ncbi:MAG: hypothetical protein DMG06_14410 [Acidobacteria bacterium]|nr:MAG: hypothetical protein DMG06_14410 [Acidobacteriota bacterium]
MTTTSTGAQKASLETVQAKSEKIILVLQTRNNLITVYSGNEASFYSVATETGISLADHLTSLELKARFPELYDVVTGWAGDAAEMKIVPHR